MYLAAQCISYHIFLIGVVLQGEIIVFEQFKPMAFPHIQFLLGEQIFEAFMIKEKIKSFSIQVMPPNFKGKDNRSQFEIVRGIILLVWLQLSRSIGYNSAFLHQHTPKSLM